MVMEVIPSAAGKSSIMPAKHRTSRISAFLARISVVLPERVCLFIPHRPHSVGAQHPKDDTAAPKQFFHGTSALLKDHGQMARVHFGHQSGAQPRQLIMNRRRDGGSDRFLAALTMSFALKTSAKMVASAQAMQGCNCLELATPGLPAVWPCVVSL